MIDRIKVRLARALDGQGSARFIRADRGAVVGSSVGQVRTRNEDCCFVARGSHGGDSLANFAAAIVCDGLGGMSQGREAAIHAASTFVASLFDPVSIEWKGRLERAIGVANMEVHRLLRGDGGTTLSAVVIPQRGSAFLCHVGDSRIYGVTGDRALEQLSRDDTMNALLNRRDGGLDPIKDSRLLQFVGMGDEMEPQIEPIPNHFRSVLITSDGAHDVPHGVLQRVVSAASGGNDLIRKLLSLSEMMGGRDNASAILMPLGGETDLYADAIETELLAVLPHETLTICVVTSDGRDQTVQGRGGMPADAKADVPKVVEQASGKPSSSNEADSAPASPAPAKTKARTTKSQKPKKRKPRRKAGGEDRLPLDGADDEVNVQFSDEDKQ